MNSGGVVLLHGILRAATSMSSVQVVLEEAGYAVLNLDYPSTTKNLQEIADHIHPAIAEFSAKLEGKLHFVTHSMGGLVARVYLASHRPVNLGRVVMLAPPNQGSELADVLGDFWAYKMLFGPAGQQLVTNEAEKLPVPDYPVGVIAGNRSVYPVASLFLPGENDGRVSLERARINADGPLYPVPASHPVIMQHRLVHEAVKCFLETGAFPPENAQ